MLALIVLGFIFSYCVVGFMLGCISTIYEINYRIDTNLLYSDNSINKEAIKKDIAIITFSWGLILPLMCLFGIFVGVVYIANKIGDVVANQIDKITKPKRVEEKLKRK